MPELDKVILLAQIFETTTDALLMDTALPQTALNIQDPPAETECRQLDLPEAKDFLALTKNQARRFAPAVAACVISPTPLILLSAISEASPRISENMAGGLGVILLLLIVAAAVTVFVTGSMELSRYKHIGEERFQPGPGLTKWAQEEKEDFHATFSRNISIGVVLCILGVVPLVAAAMAEAGGVMVCLTVDILLWVVAIAVYLFVRVGMVQDCFSQLLQIEDYTPQHKKLDRNLAAPYWCLVTVIYLIVSFLTRRWDTTWLVWACAGILYVAIVAVFSARNRD